MMAGIDPAVPIRRRCFQIRPFATTGRLRVTMPIIDPSNPDQRQAIDLLREREIGWLTTVSGQGKPHSVPVWFMLDDGGVIIFSEPKTVKVRNIRESPYVTFTLETGEEGNDVVIIDGTAEISDRDAASWLATFREAYERKYARAIEAFGMPLDQLVEKFSTVIVVTPTKMRHW